MTGKVEYPDSIRDLIAEIVSSGYMHHTHTIEIATTILSVLTNRIPDLEWEGFSSGPYKIEIHEGGIADLFFYGNSDEEDFPEMLMGGYLSLISMDDLKNKAQKHHTDILTKALGLT
jgi:hypothetical protein